MTYEFLPREEPGKPLMRVSPGFADRVMQRFEDYERQQKRRRTIAIVVTAFCLLGGVFIMSMRRMDDGRWPGIPQRQPDRAVTPPLNAGSVQQPAPSRDIVKAETSVPAPLVDRMARRPKPAPAVSTAPLQQQASSQDTMKQSAPVTASVDGAAIASSRPDTAEVPAAKAIYVRRAVSPGDSVKPGTPVTHAVGLVQLQADALARAGLRPGDIVITIDGKEIHDPSQAESILEGRDKCTPLRIELLREGKLLTFVIHPPRDAGSSPCGDEP